MSKTYVAKRAAERGIPIVDATEPVRVAVTKHDVVYSFKANSKDCALATACKRIRGVAAAYFFRGTAFLDRGDRIERYVLPPSVQREIVSFDRAKVFEPGLYQLTPPSPSRAPAAQAAKRRKAERKAAVRASTGGGKPTRSTKTDRRVDVAANVAKVWEREAGDLPRLTRLLEGKRAPSKPHRTVGVRGLKEPS